MTPETTFQQICSLLQVLMRNSLCDRQNFPVWRNRGSVKRIEISGAPDLSTSMKNRSYSEIYEELAAANAFHICMMDGALLQLLYQFDRRRMIKHRLSYFPAPDLQSYDEAPEVYEREVLFSEIFSHSTVRSPLRFDYSADEGEHVELDHPKCHLTLGQYETCRIPVTHPLTPNRFLRFILRSFYAPAYETVNFDRAASQTSFHESITNAELAIAHFSP
jgi:hypothetical protein